MRLYIKGLFLLLALPLGAAEFTSPENVSLPLSSDTLITDSLSIDTIDSHPEWYVAPEIPLSLRAPKRATAATPCNKVAAIRTYDINAKLVEGTYYEYDNAGHVISTTVWKYNEDSTKYGKSRQEYGFDTYNNQVATIVYDWDNDLNIWHGVSRYEYVYDEKKRMLSNTEYAWIKNEWVADTKYTWGYDAEGRDAEYFAYTRNESTNQLVPVNGYIYTWLNDTQKSSEIIYTAYSNGAWSEGTKKIWEYDAAGNNTLYEYYASISNGKWIGSSKDTWTYGGPSGQLTLHERFGWADNDWSKTLKEETEYAGNNKIRVENYTYANGITTGTKKETWTYGGPNGQLTLHEQFGWADNDWSKTLREETEYAGSNIVRIENYTYANGVTTGTKKELTSYTNGKKTEYIVFTWKDEAWVNSTREVWAFNTSKQPTLHEKYDWVSGDWLLMSQENTAYNGNTTSVENYERKDGEWVGAKKEENTVVGGKTTQTIIYTWNNGTWDNTSKENWAYSGSKPTLHETYQWYNDDWSVTLREISGYDTAGNKNSVENYTGSEGTITGTLKEEYTFNTAKEVVVTIKYKWEEGAWSEDTKNEVGYTEGNTEYSEANYTWDGSGWVGLDNKTVTVYYATNKVLVAWAYAWSTTVGDWVYAARRLCEYDAKSRSIGDTTYTYVNDTWEYYKLQTHGYDTHDNDTLAITATWNGTEWVPTEISKGTFLYNDSGNQLLLETYTGLEGAWVGKQKKVWEYNESGSPTLYNAFQWKGGWTNKEKREQTYNAKNQPLTDESYTWNGNRWAGVDKYEYGYDEYGQPCMSAHYIWLNGKWFGLTKSEQIMDEDGVPLTSFSFSWKTNTNKWEYTFKYDFLYDEEGRPIDEKTSRYRDGWNNYLWVTHSYYGSGKNSEEIAKYERMWNSQKGWQLISMYEKHYDEPEHQIREHEIGSWNSSTGDLVSYTNDHYYYDCDPHFYTIRFNNSDSTVVAYQTEVEGHIVEYHGTTPTKQSTDEHSYTFAGWSPALATVTGDATYTAIYDSTINQYTITWLNEDGSEIDKTTLAYGATPTHANPSKPSTAEYSYTFAGWTPKVVAVTENATYKATYNTAKRSYTITWQNDDGTQIDQTTVEYGVVPTHDNPTKQATAEYTYTFAGWTPQVVAVTDNATYKATYTAKKNEFTITWKNDDGSQIDQTAVALGVVPTHADPTKQATAEYTYTFAGWTPQVVAATADASYQATFTKTKRSYTISWLDDDGTTINQTTVEYGTTPAHANINKESTAQYTYTFAGWSPKIVPVTGNASYTATYTTTVNTYTITFYFDDGTTILEQIVVPYGETPSCHYTPSKEGDSHHYYTFTGWSPEIVPVTGDASYVPTFELIARQYTITFKNYNNKLLQSIKVDYGAIPEYTGETPTKPASAQGTYEFAGWTPELVPVEGDATYKAVFESILYTYTITFYDEDGTTILDEVTVEHGKMPTTAVVPIKAEDDEYTYTFAGWSPKVVKATANAAYIAVYTAKPKYDPEGVRYTETEEQATKILVNGQIYIRRGGHTYSVDGSLVY